MSTKTLEDLFKQSDFSAKQPLELWKQIRRSKRNYPSNGPAFIKRASLSLDAFASRP